MVAAKTWPMGDQVMGEPISLGDGAGQLVVAGLDAGGERGDDVGALGRGHLRPRAVVERLAGGGDGAVDVGVGGLGDLGDDLFGVGRDHVELVGARRLDPVAADEELVLVHLFSSDRVLEP